ncbi:hypothetical protein P152DRAFT_454686 [Eremomyces bilateralis CBS 781.70]|uniref:Bacteriophage T5 Orf172 DNA-binding domain-containing protein n=1 Tax=Eremomyces bilateralis CBS 781.70 TaxID=1392243 RepID=A0A6G1GEH0_9PEZI|nr:uncharacterized protein P152DRAFT_454686 [Eremomyces bilateralis CBS 781.70]KAF1816422.1 hypothetical protein P152DRAFT_454686 [Eremomyces bilateralis CBS 781.70]
MKNFQAWKEARSHHPSTSWALPATPKDSPASNSDWDNAYSDAENTAADSPDSEPDGIFDMVSPASTAATTPGPTPHFEEARHEQIAGKYDDDELEPRSRPDTPTPATGLKKGGNSSYRGLRQDDRIDDENDGASKEHNELAGILREHHDLGPELLGRIDRRFKSVKSKKWPLMEAIEKRFTSMDGKKGKVYVWTNKDNSRFVKIGFTQHDSDKRAAQPNNCYARNTVRHWESEVHFVGAYRVEQIVRRSLSERNISLISCALCKTAHREWFEIDAKEAVMMVIQWTKFVIDAYADGRLNERGRRLMDRLCNIDTGALERALEAEDDVQAATGNAIPGESQSESEVEGEPKGAPAMANKLVEVPQATEEISTTTPANQVSTPVSYQSSANSPTAPDKPVSAREPELRTARAWTRRLPSWTWTDEAEQRTWRGILSDGKTRSAPEPSKRLQADKSGDSESKARVKDDEGEDPLFASLVGQFYSAELGERLRHAGDKSGARLKGGTIRILKLLKSSRFRYN